MRSADLDSITAKQSHNRRNGAIQKRLWISVSQSDYDLAFMKRSRILVMVAVVLSGLAAGLAIYARSHGFSARPEPSFMEALLARRVRTFAIPSSARDAKNPVPSSAGALSEAMEHFADHCAICHANDGSGDTPTGKGLYPRPPDMRSEPTQSLSDGEIYWVIHNGVRFTGMPAFGDEKAGMSDEDSWKLVHFIRHLPKITDEEIQAMKKLNPMSPAVLQEEEAIRRFLAGEDVEPAATGHRH
jgi:mono/diheme cytochrome c family protein